MTVRILVVDDHEVVRSGLRAVLEGDDSLRVLGEAATQDDAVERAEALRPDVVLMDVRLGDDEHAGSGIEACRIIRSALPDTQVLMFSSYGEREAVVASILAGAAGFVTKNVARAQLLYALHAVARGESLLDSKVTAGVLERLKELASTDNTSDDPLSRREGEVLALIARGLTNRQIAETLVISEHTARNHVTSILDKLGMSRRTEAAAYAVRAGLLRESRRPKGPIGLATGLITILFTDIAYSTELTERLGDARAQELVRAHNAIVREALSRHQGSEIKHTGDGIMASFTKASSALACAVSIQRAVAKRGDGNLQVHIGLNAGEPVAEERDLFGTAVQLARRICDVAEGGEILVSNVVRELAAGKRFAFEDRGAVVLKGFADPAHVYAVLGPA